MIRAGGDQRARERASGGKVIARNRRKDFHDRAVRQGAAGAGPGMKSTDAPREVGGGFVPVEHAVRSVEFADVGGGGGILRSDRRIP